MRESGDSSTSESNTDWNENNQSAWGMLVQPPKTKIQTSNKHAAEMCLVDCKCVHLHPLWCPSPFPRFRHLQAPAVGLRIHQDGPRMILETEWDFEKEYKKKYTYIYRYNSQNFQVNFLLTSMYTHASSDSSASAISTLSWDSSIKKTSSIVYRNRNLMEPVMDSRSSGCFLYDC